MMDKETFMHRKGEILHEARMDGNDTFDGLAGSIVYWQDVANHAHEKRVEAEQRIAQLWEYIGALEDRISTLEAALVEEKAKALYYAYADRSYIYGWLDVNEDDREQWRDRSRVELEELGILQKGAE